MLKLLQNFSACHCVKCKHNDLQNLYIVGEKWNLWTKACTLVNRPATIDHSQAGHQENAKLAGVMPSNAKFIMSPVELRSPLAACIRAYPIPAADAGLQVRYSMDL